MNTTNLTPLVKPYTILVDDREKLEYPYKFEGLKADSDNKYRPLIIRTKTRRLLTGDYTIEGLEDVVTVERKTKSDLYNTIAWRRQKFREEHERMAAMTYAAVVIESSAIDVLRNPPKWRRSDGSWQTSQLPPKIIFRTMISWGLKYGVHWYMCDRRRVAEITCYQVLDKFYRLYSKLLEESNDGNRRDQRGGNHGSRPGGGTAGRPGGGGTGRGG